MSATNVTEAQIQECLKSVQDPEIGRSLSDLQMLKKITVSGENVVAVEVELPTPAYPRKERIADLVRSTIELHLPQVSQVEVAFSHRVRGKESGGALGLKIKNVVAVGSGKGGVGKSTMAASIAFGLKSLGARVGLMDADVYGPSIPHMLGAHGRPAVTEHQTAEGQPFVRIEPIIADGVKLISMGFFIEPDQAVVWRGPMLHKALTQFVKDTEWGELDYLIIDLPPGTGDVSLTLSQMLGLAGAVIVCTPQQVALLDAVKAISMFGQVKIPVLGIVENMSGEIFGRGGAKRKAEELGVPFLGEIPIEADIRVKGDEGKISALFAEDSPARPHLLHVCEQMAMQIAKQLLETPQMPTLEIL